MLVVITYDVNTEDREGRRRLRLIARQCVCWTATLLLKEINLNELLGGVFQWL